MGDYDDIINLPHHQSAKRPHMSNAERAAQFSPFAALTGYEDVLEETARLTDRRMELSESEQAELDRQLQWLRERSSEKPMVAVTCFQPDEKKDGGSYVTLTGQVRRVDEVQREIVFADGSTTSIDNLFSVQIISEEG